MKHFGPKIITLEQVVNEYPSIVAKSHFVADGNKEPNENDIKEISGEMIHLLMILGTSGLNFLRNMLNGKSPISGFTESDQFEIYCVCDGFGKRTPHELLKINDGWDWSHVRDSSKEALDEAEKNAKNKLIDLYNRS